MEILDVQDWKVEELAEDGDNWKIIVEIANDKDETSVEQKLGDIGERLKSTAPVDRVFPKFVAPKGRVHIVVHEDSDLDEESGTRKKEKQTLKTLTSLLASSILQPPAVKVPSHKFYDRNQAKKSMLKVARYNGSKYIRGFDDKENPSVRIGARVAVASGLLCLSKVGFHDNSDLQPLYLDLQLFTETNTMPEYSYLHDLLITNNKKLFRLSDVICEVLQRQQCSAEAIIIHLDEYQLYINDVQQHQG
ncbi:unnamed protein product [Rhizophagus irregularis]|nr:unnamed protein product [Rhizophagus irregularis]